MVQWFRSRSAISGFCFLENEKHAISQLSAKWSRIDWNFHQNIETELKAGRKALLVERTLFSAFCACAGNMWGVIIIEIFPKIDSLSWMPSRICIYFVLLICGAAFRDLSIQQFKLEMLFNKLKWRLDKPSCVSQRIRLPSRSFVVFINVCGYVSRFDCQCNSRTSVFQLFRSISLGTFIFYQESLLSCFLATTSFVLWERLSPFWWLDASCEALLRVAKSCSRFLM